jgi:hypothetical protein
MEELFQKIQNFEEVMGVILHFLNRSFKEQLMKDINTINKYIEYGMEIKNIFNEFH